MIFMENLLLFRGNSFDANFFYHAKIDVDNSFYFRCGEKEMLLVPKLNERAARLSFRGEVRAYKKPMEEIAKLAKGTELSLDYSSLPAKMYDVLRRACKATDASSDLLKLRARKTPQEILKIRKAVSLTKEILSATDISEYKTEQDMKNALTIKALEKGLETAYDPIVGSGKHSSFPHYVPARSKMGNFALVDFGVRYEHYCADITRVFFRGKKEKKVSGAYEKAHLIFHEIIDAMPDFETGRDLALFSEKRFEKHGLPEPIHSIGHGVGLDIHEYPRLNRKYSDPLKGTVIAIEPAAYFKNFGVRYEETVYFDGKKARVL